MSIQVDNNKYQTVGRTEHPSMKPLKFFHGHIVKTFSSLPEKGKLFEIIKRIIKVFILIVLAPIAYPSLAMLGLLGYPLYAAKTTEQVPVQEEDSLSFTDRCNSINDKVKKRFLSGIKVIANDPKVSKMKYFIYCKNVNDKELFEVSLPVGDSAANKAHVHDLINQSMEKVKNWFSKKITEDNFNEEIKFSGEIYFLSDGLRTLNWDEKCSFGRVRDCSEEPFNFSGPVLKEKETEYLKIQLQRIGINLQEDLKSTSDFFERNFFANQ